VLKQKNIIIIFRLHRNVEHFIVNKLSLPLCHNYSNFRVARSVKCLHSITHSYDYYLYSQITIRQFLRHPWLSLTLHHSINYNIYISWACRYTIVVLKLSKNLSNGNEFDHPLIYIACGRMIRSIWFTLNHLFEYVTMIYSV